MNYQLSFVRVFVTDWSLTRRGVAFLSAPETMPWGGVLAHLRDPDGNVLTLLGR